MCLAGIQALLTILMGGFFVICDLTLVPLFSWVSWKDTHSNFDLVNQYPAIIWHNIPGARMIEFTRWMCIICSILFFSLFGFAQEARFHYCLIIKFFVKFLGIRNGRPAEVLTFHTAPLSPSDPIVWHSLTKDTVDLIRIPSGYYSCICPSSISNLSLVPQAFFDRTPPHNSLISKSRVFLWPSKKSTKRHQADPVEWRTFVNSCCLYKTFLRCTFS